MDLPTLQSRNIELVQIATVREETMIQESYTGCVTLCLLLEPGNEEGTFRRIRLAEVPDLPDFALKPWELREVMII
ncbi:hypothetical protein BDZ45DRAFT_28124 [Acephala macrosclerotiorum]|nr:hypothetical protein BDZ45DRAFT_28124 [Acephala macrosclerotiorum]